MNATENAPIPDPRAATHPATHPVVALSGVSRRFGELPALDNINLTLNRGEILGLIGRSGAGKSTLIRCLNGLERPDSGRVEIDGQDITPLSEQALQPVRRRIGMIFQHFNLLSSKTIAENVALPLKIAGLSEARRRARVMELLDLVGLADKADAWPAQLSGGQKQRVGIARALAPEPLLLLSDEATSALDPETTHAILDLLRGVNRQLGLTVLMITHEIEVVRQIASRVVVLDRGRIVEEGPVAQVLATPRSETARSLVRSLLPVLPESIAAQVGPGGDRALIRLDVFGAQVRQPFLSLVGDVTGRPAHLVHGGISDVQGAPFGRLFIALGTADPASVARVVAVLSPLAAGVEVLGNVPAEL